MAYAQLAAQLAERAFITDPYVDGQPRFSDEAVVLSRTTYAAIAQAAEAVTSVLDELCRIVAASPKLLQSFFQFTSVQQAMFEISHPMWHGHARADVFFRPGAPPVVCEVNCDTPSAQAEAVALNGLAHDRTKRDRPDLQDPCAKLPAALMALIAMAARRGLARTSAPTVGILYPTEMPEDLALVRFWRGALEARGHAVVLGSPFNLHAADDGGICLFGQRVDVVLRHYKTDWWAERTPLWHDEMAYADSEPLAKPLGLLLEAQLRAKTFVINPFGAVLPQNKRCYAFLWEHRGLFSQQAQAAIAAHVPFSMRLEAADFDRLRRERETWVLKSDYGCEGEEVLIGAAMSQHAWSEALRLARPHRWIAQRRFDTPADHLGRIANHGVFLVGGQAHGVYTRLSAGATNRAAVSVPTLVSP